MQLAEFQEWVRGNDQETQWHLLTMPQLLCHLAEEVGELIRAVNHGYNAEELTA